VRIRQPEEDHFARLLVRIAARQRQAETLEEEIVALRQLLSAFSGAVLERVDSLLTEVRQARVVVADLEASLAQQDETYDPELADVLAKLAEQWTGLLMSGSHKLPDEGPAAEVPSVNRTGIPVGGPVDENGSEGNEDEEALLGRGARQTTPQREAARREAQGLYRDLARRYHPDWASSDSDRTRREAIMARVNAAYAELDLVQLRRFAREIDAAIVAEAKIEAKIAWAENEIDRLGRLIAGQQEELARLQDTRAYKLWLQQQAGEAVFARVERDLSRERFRLARRLRELRRQAERSKTPAAPPRPAPPKRRLLNGVRRPA
jgi:predicted  nucleic acid-binding Zn-ribbon protein